MVHKTPSGERIKHLRTEARKLSAALAAARQLADVEDLADLQARLQERQEAAQAEAAALQSSGQARLEDLSVFKAKKEMKKGKEHEYWHAAWVIDGKTRNVYLGSCKKMGRKEALEKARKRKAGELGIEK
jgi:hypothetical protein